VRLLIDTNIFLEIILDQANSKTAQELLSRTWEHEFFMSDYSLHSIGILLFRRKQKQIFSQFLLDMVYQAGIRIMSLTVEDMEGVIEVSNIFNLDFDDAYQYQLAELHDLIIISFDSDFDRTTRGRKTPHALPRY